MNIVKLKMECEKLKISIKTQEKITANSFLELKDKDKSHYFEVYSIETIDYKTLLVEAVETGYWCNLYQGDIDIRELFSKDVSLVTDAQTILRIKNESRYC